jgi:hypothetical protein
MSSQSELSVQPQLAQARVEAEGMAMAAAISAREVNFMVILKAYRFSDIAAGE